MKKVFYGFACKFNRSKMFFFFFCLFGSFHMKNEPPHDKTNKWHVRPAKTQISLGIHPVWSESSLSTWRKPRVIWVFTGRTVILLVLSCVKLLQQDLKYQAFDQSFLLIINQSHGLNSQHQRFNTTVHIHKHIWENLPSGVCDQVRLTPVC